jgi:hypothetical protein
MLRRLATGRLLLLAAAAALLVAALGAAQVPPLRAPGPRLEPVAETKLLMEGLAQPNFEGLGKLLRAQPNDPQAWVYARGQALLLAETGNLLMLRPPRNAGQSVWLERAADLRGAASRLARSLAARDYERSRAGLGEVATNCNRCHQTFRVRARVAPFAGAEPDEP